ncbi:MULTISPECIES: hypothetical protein [unclassified Oleiphilus]|uniref:hypothetical protein n=1 Tax=unclassified Oleiphilus TaxID=2631174 RepID=UPI0007C2E464|nr:MULTISPECIES: hypothetical protein [unclassified Oleiphilus]KZY42913.1 hypothetical protein A3732_15460 [Oleiphilus sp. HI0050]KZZ34836.1 hypothetical protein A3757_16985 [Oleiphilus sp. HI0117]KZZ61420.1 hypothetical protein A3761_04295 [Oleiphilus sp. HI0123]
MRFVCMLILGLLSFGGIAGAQTGASGLVDIKTLRIGGGFLRVTGSTDFQDPSDCNGSGQNSNRDVLIFEGIDSYNEIVSFALAAKMANQKVQFWLDGCGIDSGRNYPKASYIYLID